MITTLFTRAAHKYLSLPLFGPVINDFAVWLEQQGYTFYSRRYYVWVVACLDKSLRRRRIKRLPDITPQALHDSLKAKRRRSSLSTHTCVADLLERFLTARGLLASAPPCAPSTTERQLQAYAEYLREVRGCAPSTLRNHLRTASRLLSYLAFETGEERLVALQASDLEGFLRHYSPGQSRGTLQHIVAELRSLLRFLALTGKIKPGLENQLDTPRLYRQEQLPRALPWETVQTLLQSIPRDTPRGQRDYTMFFLMATYGLRCSEVVALTLEDIQWRAGRLRVPQPKTGTQLDLPLTEAAASVLIAYLRKAARPTHQRQLFLRLRAPLGALRPHAVTEAFHTWAARSGLAIPDYGAHCLRHSYAVQLLRQGASLKAIGDLLGHRCAESTTDYLRLATEDLRDVALPVPPRRAGKGGRQ